MKLLHLADLHLGKRVNEYSMLDDQKFILNSIQNIIKSEAPHAVLIAGDVYDKSVPPVEAVEMFDDFLVALASLKLSTFIISGNHDSAERLAFGNRLIKECNIHISPAYSGDVTPVTLNDEYGPVNIYMLPFIKPSYVKAFFPDDEITDYTQAVRCAVRAMKHDTSKRNVILAHQFVTGAARCESEVISVGGSDNVDVTAFESFDYVALGHLHRPQIVESEAVRYAGSPLKYSFSEASHKKSVTIVELEEKGSVSIRTVELKPKYDMVEIKGSYEELTLKSYYEGTSYREDYMHVTLTDEEDIPDAVGKLRTIYHNLMKLDYDNTRTAGGYAFSEGEATAKRTPFDAFTDFFTMQNRSPMSEEQSEYLKKLIGEIWDD